MARTNKYSSLNFNDIYDKKLKPSQSPSSSSPSQSPSSSTGLHSDRTHHHGRMLVLTRPTPTPKPVSIPQPQHHQHLPSSPSTPPTPQPPSAPSDQIQLESNSISLRPLGRSGFGPTQSQFPSPVLGQDREKDVLTGSASPKSDRFVPPHLRPGFVRREEKFGSAPGPNQIGVRSREYGNRHGPHHGSPGQYGEDGRPKSGGGNERMRRGSGGGGEPVPVEMSRPGSGGNRLNLLGWYVCLLLVLCFYFELLKL